MRGLVPGLVPRIHIFYSDRDEQDVDGRDKRGHDDLESPVVESEY
jgi:hypothetical protein